MKQYGLFIVKSPPIRLSDPLPSQNGVISAHTSSHRIAANPQGSSQAGLQRVT